MPQRQKQAKNSLKYDIYLNIFSRVALSIVYFWFGVLKVLQVSPAEDMVLKLVKVAIPFVPATEFCIFLGFIEVIIGILFLFPRFTKILVTLVLIHMSTTILPLFILPHDTWSGVLTPTLAGQYIIKNIVIVALSLTLVYDYEKVHKKQ